MHRLEHAGTTLLSATFADIENLCDEVRTWNLDFKPISKGTGNGPVAELVQMQFGSVGYDYARFAASIDQKGEAPQDRHSFTILSPRTRYLWWRGQSVGAGDVLVYRDGSEFESWSGDDFEVQVLSVTEDQVLTVAEREGMRLPPIHRRPEIFQPSQRLLTHARDILSVARNPVVDVGVTVIRDLADRLILAWLRQFGLQKSRVDHRRKGRALARGVEFIHTSPFRQLPVADLSAAVGVSRRTLETAFFEQFGVGPAAFMKNRRLVAVRRELLSADPQKEAVGDIMLRFGFSHVGQFAADYRRVFGEKPSDSLMDTSR